MNGLLPFERAIGRTTETLTAAAMTANGVTGLQDLLDYRSNNPVLSYKLSPRHGYVTLVSGYLVLTGVHWS